MITATHTLIWLTTLFGALVVLEAVLLRTE